MQYDIDYGARKSWNNGDIYMAMNVTGLCNVQRKLDLRDARKNGTFGCTIKTNSTKQIMVI